ncbi:MAG: gluconate 2-dehydrogenase subunit 3 family protein, partial [Actinobacteria bacterium]|nr:gluconate 2-dehydrogenase subunit 3 family protein [Actinomycetota bacterium]
PAGLPRQRRGTTPQMHGRFPDYDVLANAGHWDELTRAVVLERVRAVPSIRFFTAREAACLGPFLDVVLAQDDEPRIPVLAMVDKKLSEGKLDGYQYADMPDDRDTWRLVARGLDETARERGGGSYACAGADLQHDIVGEFAQGALGGGAWAELNVARAWSVVMRGALGEFYSHPWAWNEIGFGGPAYPRGYMRRAVGDAGREPYEAAPAIGLDPVRDTRRRGTQ